MIYCPFQTFDDTVPRSDGYLQCHVQTGAEAMFADLGHFNIRAIQVPAAIVSVFHSSVAGGRNISLISCYSIVNPTKLFARSCRSASPASSSPPSHFATWVRRPTCADFLKTSPTPSSSPSQVLWPNDQWLPVREIPSNYSSKQLFAKLMPRLQT